MTRSRVRVVRRHGFVSLVAATILVSGCAARADEASTIPQEVIVEPLLGEMIPLPRDGDTAVYATENYRSFLEVRAKWEGSPSLGDVMNPMLKRAYSPLDAPPAWPPYREAIDSASNRLAFSVDPCPFNLEGRCKGPYWAGYETWRSEVAGLPWGYGSSIFQGRFLEEGLAFNETFVLGLVPVTVRFEVIDAWTSENETLFAVRGTLPFEGNATEMIAGTWTVSSASPFALSYQTNLTLAGTKTSTFSFGINATLSERTRGAGPVIVDPKPAWKTPTFDASKSRPLEGGLPVGADAEIGLEGYTFRGAWEHLLREKPENALAASSPGFRLWSMQVPREETSGGALLLHEHHVEGSFSYFAGDRFESEFVSHDCSWIDVIELELSCDYSGTGPTDGPRGMRGNVSFETSIDFRDAHALANESLPRPTRIFLFSTYTNGVEASSARQEAYAFSFFFPLLDGEGELAPSGFGHVRIDALTGEVRSRTLENV